MGKPNAGTQWFLCKNCGATIRVRIKYTGAWVFQPRICDDCEYENYQGLVDVVKETRDGRQIKKLN